MGVDFEQDWELLGVVTSNPPPIEPDGIVTAAKRRIPDGFTEREWELFQSGMDQYAAVIEGALA